VRAEFRQHLHDIVSAVHGNTEAPVRRCRQVDDTAPHVVLAKSHDFAVEI
jgi:hypothetical protein